MLKCIKPCRGGVRIDLQVIPNSKKGGLACDEAGERLKVRITEPALKGRANKAVLKKFSDLFGNCELVSGSLSRKKTILIRDVCVDYVDKILKTVFINQI